MTACLLANLSRENLPKTFLLLDCDSILFYTKAVKTRTVPVVGLSFREVNSNSASEFFADEDQPSRWRESGEAEGRNEPVSRTEMFFASL